MSQAAALEPVAVSDLPEDSDALYEVVKGKRVELPPMGVYPNRIASKIQMFLGNYAEPKGLGTVVTETLFVLVDDEDEAFKRRPDVAFVSAERWPLDREILDVEAWDVVPNLVVEVVSRTDRFNDVLAKLREYFAAGVERAWLVVPPERQVYVYESPTRVTILDSSSELDDGGALLPGFLLPVARLFGPLSESV